MTEAPDPGVVAPDRPRLIVVVGATGTGKSGLALDLAEHLANAGHRAEIVGADAMQLYRGMDIGTAKVPVAERRGIPHHLIDVLDPSDDATVAAYQREARAVIASRQAEGITPILVGGSGLYVAAVTDGLEFPGADAGIRAELESELESRGLGALAAELVEVDPEGAARLDLANPRRVVRALEVWRLTGASLVPGRGDEHPRWQLDALTLHVRRDRAELVPVLDARVEQMWRDGLLDEARALESDTLSTTAARAIGYAQAFDQLAGALSEAEAIGETQRLTRRYARRQVSWFRRISGAIDLDPAHGSVLDQARHALSEPDLA